MALQHCRIDPGRSPEALESDANDAAVLTDALWRVLRFLFFALCCDCFSGLDLWMGDSLEFKPHAMTWEDIRKDSGYPCRRFTILFRFDPRHARQIKLDLNFGDPITPAPGLIEIHPMLDDFQGGQVLGYPGNLPRGEDGNGHEVS